MLDLDDSGEVDMEEFVSGCLRLKGNAKSIDIHTLMFEIKYLMRKWDSFMNGATFLEERAHGGEAPIAPHESRLSGDKHYAESNQL